jgi:ribosome-binding factor A
LIDEELHRYGQSLLQCKAKKFLKTPDKVLPLLPLPVFFVIMESTRQKKVARLVQKELGNYFQRGSSSFSSGRIITVTVVRISPDLSLAKVYLSIFPSDNAGEVLQTILDNRKIIRHELGKKVRHQLRTVPELAFFVDDSLDYVDNIEELLKK